jgi:hypothetical protein
MWRTCVHVHAQDPNLDKSLRIAQLAYVACLRLDARRSMLYCDLVLACLPEAAQRALQAMDSWKYQYRSEFARRFFAAGRAEIILKQLATRYGALSDAVEARIRAAGSAELDRLAERVLTARTLEEALGVPSV